jgi:5'-deoxynucleotidase YfbR-like HD superfamily hydrolase
MKNIETFMQIHDAGRTIRFHTIRFMRFQNVAEHSWNVAQIIRYLWPNSSKELICAALDHDVAERWSGDIPSPFKNLIPEIRPLLDKFEVEKNLDLGLQCHTSLTENEKKQLLIADILDFVLACRDEFMMGNTHRDLSEVSSRGMKYLSMAISDAKLDDETTVKIHHLMGNR